MVEIDIMSQSWLYFSLLLQVNWILDFYNSIVHIT
jgi:hypothetical protein